MSSRGGKKAKTSISKMAEQVLYMMNTGLEQDEAIVYNLPMCNDAVQRGRQQRYWDLVF